MKKTHKRNRIDTTLGELIATISDIALANSDDAKEARELTRLVLMKILEGASLNGKIINRPLFGN